MSNFKNQSVGTQGDAAPDQATMHGMMAKVGGVPVAVADGELVRMWADAFGRQITAGFSQALNAMSVQETSPALLMTLEQTLLDAVTATGASSPIDVSNYHNFTLHIVAASVSTGGAVKVQSSLDGVNWADVSTSTIGSSGVTEVTMSGKQYKYLRANLSARTDGTYTVYLMAGN